MQLAVRGVSKGSSIPFLSHAVAGPYVTQIQTLTSVSAKQVGFTFQS